MEIICLDSVDSTNTWVAANESKIPSPSMIRAFIQTGGRGQRGNKWESEPEKNFTGSVIIHPQNFPASSQFLISEAFALSVVATLLDYGIRAKIKWPNDIYVGNGKICGILTEHSVLGRNISRTISGIGVNVNQVNFISDAPNPVSMKLITGQDYDIGQFSLKLASKIESFLKIIGESEEIHSIFLRNLWRHDDEFYNFFDKKSKENIKAKIKVVAFDGILTLQLKEGEERNYAFKEVEFII